MAKRKPRKYNAQGLREFRHKVAILKRKGLVSPKVDARKQRPTGYMVHKLNVFKAAVEGKLEPVHVGRRLAREYQEAGFLVSRNRVLMPAEVARSVRRTKKPTKDQEAYLTSRRLVGTASNVLIERVYLPVTVKNWDRFMARLRRGEFDHLKRPQDQFAFTFFGGMSQKSFKSSEELYDYLQHYTSIESFPNQSWEHFILYRIYPPGTWEQLGGGLTYPMRRGALRGPRSERGKPGRKARFTMDELKARAEARRRTPEFKAHRAEYMQGYRTALAEEKGKTKRKYVRRKRDS